MILKNSIAWTMIHLIFLVICNKSNGQESVMNHLSYRSDINHRYAVTWVTAHMENPSDNATEILFKMTLPKTAFISGLIMEVEGRNYTSRVEEKKKAAQIYKDAKEQGVHAGLVEHSGSAEQKFEVSTNVKANGKVIFYLKYEELLLRSKGKYTQNIQIKPGVNPSELDVTVNIKESAEILGLKVLKSPLGADEKYTGNSLSGTHVRQVSSNHTVVSYNSQGPDGLYGELTLTYDVKREKDAGKMMVMDGYFVHFFSPDGLEKMPAHTVFILDTSGSMSGDRLQKLKESMEAILSDLQPEDSFELLTFSSEVESLGVFTKRNSNDMELAMEKISNLEATGSTNVNDALIHGMKNAIKGCQNTANQIVFLTDGEANTGETNPLAIIDNIREVNTGRIPLYSLAYGNDLDFKFLNKISFHNRGFARKIPVDSNTTEILRGFYQEIGTPLMADIDIKYPENAVNQTTIVKNGWSTLQAGNEIIVAGQMIQDENEFYPEENGILNTGSHKFKVPRLSKTSQFHGKENFIGRLWAYLTIQNLTKTAELSEFDVEKDELNSRARSLALKFNFVTKLTSLVVVRPGDLPEETKDTALYSEEEKQEENDNFRVVPYGGTRGAAIPQNAPLSPLYSSVGLSSGFSSLMSSSSSSGFHPSIKQSSYGASRLRPHRQSINRYRRPTNSQAAATSLSIRPASTSGYGPLSRPFPGFPSRDDILPDIIPAICDQACMNGQCVGSNTCSCSSGWTGELCDIRICDPECVMGELISPNNCSCSSGWIGQHCDKRCPNDFFHSSGKCYKVLTDEKVNWQDAKSKCSSRGLKAVSNPSDPAGLRRHIIDNHNIGTLVWLDAQGADSHYVWQQDNSTLSFTDPLWKSGEPKPYRQGDDSCLYLITRNIDWKKEPESPYGGARCADKSLAFALCEM